MPPCHEGAVAHQGDRHGAGGARAEEGARRRPPTGEALRRPAAGEPGGPALCEALPPLEGVMVAADQRP